MSLNKASKLLVLDAINLANLPNLPTPLLPTDLDMALPVAAAEGAPANTYLTVTATETAPFQGSKSFHYTRLDLQLMLNGLNLTFRKETFYDSVMDLVQVLNQRYQLALDATDIVDGPIPNGVFPYVVAITAQPNSYGFTGQVELTLVAPEAEVPSNALLTVDGQPILTVEGEFILLME